MEFRNYFDKMSAENRIINILQRFAVYLFIKHMFRQSFKVFVYIQLANFDLSKRTQLNWKNGKVLSSFYEQLCVPCFITIFFVKLYLLYDAAQVPSRMTR